MGVFCLFFDKKYKVQCIDNYCVEIISYWKKSVFEIFECKEFAKENIIFFVKKYNIIGTGNNIKKAMNRYCIKKSQVKTIDFLLQKDSN